MGTFFNKELIYRVISVFIFVPIVILPLLFSNFLSIVIYLIFTSLILIEINKMKNKVSDEYIYNVFMIAVIVSFFLFLFLLITEKISIFVLLTTIITIWLFDTFSFIGGKLIGGRKLMPKISPGKTISGLITGVIITLFLIELVIYVSDDLINLTTYFVLYIIILSFLGDAVVSLLKRYASIKDTGGIMPGHGGLLDRFDSFIMVFFVLGTSNIFI